MTFAKAIANISDKRLEAGALTAAGVFYAAGAFLPWGWPSVDGYPAIERLIDPSFLLNDFYTNTTTAYNVDTLLAKALSAAQNATGIRYDVVMAALNLFRCLLWPVVFFQFLVALAGDRRLALLGALLGAASLFTLPNLFAWGWLWGDPSTAMFAVLFIVAGWTALLKRRSAIALSLFSISLLIHPLMAVHGAIFMTLIFVFDFTRDEKIAAIKSPSAWLAGVVFVALFLVQYLLLSATPDDKLSTQKYVEILAWVRHPTDFIPSLFSVSDWTAGVFSSAAALLIVLFMRREFPRWKLAVAGIVSYFVICLCGYLFVEAHPVRFFAELIPFRYVIVGAPLMLYVYMAFAAAELRDGRIAAFLLIAALFFASTASTRISALSALIPTLLCAFIGWRIFTDNRALAFLDRKMSAYVSSNALMSALALLLLILAPAAIYARRHDLIIPRAENQHSLYRWAKGSTPAGAVFLLDQYGAPGYSQAVDPQRMRLVGRRAVAASKDFPFLDKDIIPWNTRWQTALGGGERRFVSKADGEKLAAISATVPFDFVIRDQPLNDARFRLEKTFSPEYGAGEVFVYRFAR